VTAEERDAAIEVWEARFGMDDWPTLTALLVAVIFALALGGIGISTLLH
jgi:hypothetical protein